MAEHSFERLLCPIDEPLLIVLDNDDFDDDSDSANEDEIKITLQKDTIEKTKEIPAASDKIKKTTKKTINNQQTSTTIKRFKTSSSYKPTDSSCSTDCNISTLNFEEKINILTVSRMGSVYYCLEDLYEKVFASLCTIDELITLLERSALVLVKSATLSEKIAIEEKMPKLKSTQSNARYRLLSINAMDHLRKLKVLLLDRHKYQQLDEIIKGIKLPATTNVEKKAKDSTSKSKSNRKKIDEQSEVLSSGNISSIQKSKPQKSNSSTGISKKSSSIEIDQSRREEVNSPSQVIVEPGTPMPKIVAVEESVSMESERPFQYSPIEDSRGKLSTDHHCPDSSASKDSAECSSPILSQIFRQPIRLYSHNDDHRNRTSSTENPLHRVPSSEHPLITPIPSTSSKRISSPVNILSTDIDVPVKTHETSSSLCRALIDHKIVNIDHVPKLLVRHRKVYSKRTVDNPGQLYPTWLMPPNFRCVHCFTCDQVFTPQQFMIHTDDQQLKIEKPTSVSPIQLLKSERLSPEKVRLWNQFCNTLSQYVKAHLERQKVQKNNSRTTLQLSADCFAFN